MRLFLVLVLVVLTPNPIFADSLKTVTWADFWRGVDLVKKANGEWEVVYRGSSIQNLAVKLPAQTLREKFIYQFGYIRLDKPGYQAILERDLEIKFHGRVVRLVVLYECTKSEWGCKEEFSNLLKVDVLVHSHGISNRDTKGGALPDEPEFKFVVSQAAR